MKKTRTTSIAATLGVLAALVMATPASAASHGSVVMVKSSYGFIQLQDNPSGKRENLHSEGDGNRYTKDPDFASAVGEGRTCGLLMRSVIGRDKAYPNGLALGNKKYKLYVVPTKVNCN